MILDLLLLSASLGIGLRLQRRADVDQLRERLWQANYVLLIPIVATYALLSIDLDRHLLAIVGCTVSAWWITVLVAGAYARFVAPTRPMRGALWLVAAFPNTGFIGFPLAYLAFGERGLQLAVVYDEVSLLVPAIVVATVIARRHATREGGGTGAPDDDGAARRQLLRDVLLSPPLWTAVVLLTLRATVVHDPVDLSTLGVVIGHVVGPIGFLLLGLSVPLGGFTHHRREVLATSGAMLIRIGVAPALVWVVARVARVDVPGASYLMAAMPTAFLTLVISRIEQLEVEVVRLGVLVTSAIVVAGTVIAVSAGVLPGG